MAKGKPLVIYHAGCFDGFCAAWLMRQAFPDADFHAAHYGTEPPPAAMDKDRPLYVVDFSYPGDVMFKLAALRHEEMVVLDHHKTARDALDGLEIELLTNNCGDALSVTFDMGKSGGRLAWEYLWAKGLLPRDWMARYGFRDAPWLVDFSEDRDLWRHALQDTREVNAALRSFPLDFEVWDGLLLIRHQAGSVWEDFVSQGAAILRAERQIIANHVKHAREVDMDGHKILAVNATVLFSEIAGELAAGRPFGACWFVRFDGASVWSLRSREGGVDVSEIAKAHGGGGHKQAAGFEVAAVA